MTRKNTYRGLFLKYRNRGVTMSEYASTANEVADYLLSVSKESGEAPSNLKLQKLVYYAQAWFLALYDRPLFQERIEAWIHGPVQPELYRRFKHNSYLPIEDAVVRPELPELLRHHLGEIIRVYGDAEGWELEQLTHNEKPWQDARGDLTATDPSNEVIAPESMRHYYKEVKERADRRG